VRRQIELAIARRDELRAMGFNMKHMPIAEHYWPDDWVQSCDRVNGKILVDFHHAVPEAVQTYARRHIADPAAFIFKGPETLREVRGSINRWIEAQFHRGRLVWAPHSKQGRIEIEDPQCVVEAPPAHGLVVMWGADRKPVLEPRLPGALAPLLRAAMTGIDASREHEATIAILGVWILDGTMTWNADDHRYELSDLGVVAAASFAEDQRP
jgi:hypothetical protein